MAGIPGHVMMRIVEYLEENPRSRLGPQGLISQAFSDWGDSAPSSANVWQSLERLRRRGMAQKHGHGRGCWWELTE